MVLSQAAARFPVNSDWPCPILLPTVQLAHCQRSSTLLAPAPANRDVTDNNRCIDIAGGGDRRGLMDWSDLPLTPSLAMSRGAEVRTLWPQRAKPGDFSALFLLGDEIGR